jgi:hypothetical protein
MSPTSTARHPSILRRVALCAAALVVTVLPTACGAAYADDESSHAGHSEVVEVGGADAAEPRSDSDDAADEGEQQSGDAEEAAAEGEENGRSGQEQGAEQQRRNDDKGDDDKGDNGNNGNGNGNGGNGNGGTNGLDVLGQDCSKSDLEPHDGFQKAPRCVETSFGEVAAEEKNPTLLITEAPQTVKAGEDFALTVSTRNLLRDRFLGAAAGGYYLESSFLTDDGIQRGHFHTACRMLESTSEAPDPAPKPEFFLATQDNKGGAGPDTVTVTVDGGMPGKGTAQCAVWAGDGSHRTPMMQRADQIPAFDSVRITIE